MVADVKKQGIFTPSQLAVQIAKDAGIKDVVSIRLIHEGATYVYQINEEFILKLAAVEACEGDTNCIQEFCIDNLIKEYEILDHLHQYPEIPSAEVIDFGMKPRCYLLMKRFTGQALRHVWPRLNQQKRLDICFKMGQLLGKLHRVPVDTFSSQTWYFSPSQWKSVITDNIFTGEYHRLSPQEQSGVRTYVEKHQTVLDVDYTPALLHREFNDNEIFVSRLRAGSASRDEDEYEISGICDFENSLIGHYELDWVEVSKTMGTAPNLIAHFLAGYKSTCFSLSPCSVERLTLYALHELMEYLPKEDKNTIHSWIDRRQDRWQSWCYWTNIKAATAMVS